MTISLASMSPCQNQFPLMLSQICTTTSFRKAPIWIFLRHVFSSDLEGHCCNRQQRYRYAKEPHIYIYTT